jgi:hypothetical protein
LSIFPNTLGIPQQFESDHPILLLFCSQDTTDMFPLIRLLASANAAGRPVDEVTVYEWKHGRVPEAVIPQARLHLAEPTKV